MNSQKVSKKTAIAALINCSYSGVWNISVGANNSVGRHNFPKFNNSVGDLLTK